MGEVVGLYAARTEDLYIRAVEDLVNLIVEDNKELLEMKASLTKEFAFAIEEDRRRALSQLVNKKVDLIKLFTHQLRILKGKHNTKGGQDVQQTDGQQT